MWLGLIAARAAEAAAGGQSVALLYVGQAVTLLVALITGWFALRGKKSEVTDSRQARLDARTDAELDDQRALTRQWMELWQAEHAKVLRYEGYLLRASIDPDTGARMAADEPRP